MKIFPPLLTKIKQGYTTFKAEKRQKIRETATENQGNSDRLSTGLRGKHTKSKTGR